MMNPQDAPKFLEDYNTMQAAIKNMLTGFADEWNSYATVTDYDAVCVAEAVEEVFCNELQDAKNAVADAEKADNHDTAEQLNSDYYASLGV